MLYPIWSTSQRDGLILSRDMEILQDVNKSSGDEKYDNMKNKLHVINSKLDITEYQ